VLQVSHLQSPLWVEGVWNLWGEIISRTPYYQIDLQENGFLERIKCIQSQKYSDQVLIVLPGDRGMKPDWLKSRVHDFNSIFKKITNNSQQNYVFSEPS
jgi:hypothetical protein